MVSARLFGLLLFLAQALVPFSAFAQDSKLSRLLEKSPRAPNSMLYVHAASLRRLMTSADMESPLASEIDEVWLISELNSASIRPQWEAGFATLTGQQTDVTALADLVDGYVDNVGGKDVVWSPQQSYLTLIENGLGFLRPANRSLLGAWVRGEGSASVPAYLKSQAVQPEAYLSLMFATDLNDSFSPVVMAEGIKTLESLKGTNAEQVAQLFASVKGFTVIVGRQSLKECRLTLEFGISPAMIEASAPKILNEILNRNGTAAPEVAAWEAKVEGNRLALQGAIGEETLDSILGIFTLQNQAQQLTESIASHKRAAVSIKEPLPLAGKAEVTKNYFERVNKLVERVRKYDAQNTGWRAKWNEQNARRIDELVTLDVDPIAVAYGTQVSTLLRNNAMAIRGVNVRTGQQQASQSLSGGQNYYRGGYSGVYGGVYGGTAGYYDPNSSSDYQRVAGAQARMAGFGSFRNTLTEIDQITAETRKKLTEKYYTAF